MITGTSLTQDMQIDEMQHKSFKMQYEKKRILWQQQTQNVDWFMYSPVTEIKLNHVDSV